MSAQLRFGRTLALLILVSPPVDAGSSELRIGFGFCSVPFKPACVDADSAYNTDARTKACQEEVTLYVNTVIAYRACLLREMERAVLETNNILDRFKCGIAARRPCP
jgi:hypothetical protein